MNILAFVSFFLFLFYSLCLSSCRPAFVILLIKWNTYLVGLLVYPVSLLPWKTSVIYLHFYSNTHLPISMTRLHVIVTLAFIVLKLKKNVHSTCTLCYIALFFDNQDAFTLGICTVVFNFWGTSFSNQIVVIFYVFPVRIL